MYEFSTVRTVRVNVPALLTDAFGGHGGIAQYRRDLLQALATIPRVARIDAAVPVAPDREALSHPVIRQFGPRAFSSRLNLALEDHAILIG